MQKILIFVVLLFTQSSFARQLILGSDGKLHSSATTDISPLYITGIVRSVSKARLNCSDFSKSDKFKYTHPNSVEVDDCILEVESKSNGTIYKVLVNKSKCKLKVSQQIEISFNKAFTDVFPPFKCTDTVPRKLDEPRTGARGVRKAMDQGAYLDTEYKD